MSRLLLDMGLPRRTAEDLTTAGHDANHAGERDLARASDHALLELARLEKRILVTLDRDFTTILALERMRAPSVLYIRVTQLDRTRATRIILDALDVLPEPDPRGFVARRIERCVSVDTESSV